MASSKNGSTFTKASKNVQLQNKYKGQNASGTTRSNMMIQIGNENVNHK